MYNTHIYVCVYIYIYIYIYYMAIRSNHSNLKKNLDRWRKKKLKITVKIRNF